MSAAALHPMFQAEPAAPVGRNGFRGVPSFAAELRRRIGLLDSETGHSARRLTSAEGAGGCPETFNTSTSDSTPTRRAAAGLLANNATLENT